MYLNKRKGYGIQVIALVRNEKKAWEKFGEFRDDKYFSLKVQDVSEKLNITIKADYIVHAAGNASPYFIVNDPVGIINANISGTINVLEYAKAVQPKNVLYTSTREVYGKMPPDVQEISEGVFGALDPLEFRACYPESKRMAETILNSYLYQYKTPFNTARIAHSYGPGMKLDNDGRVMADFVSDIVNNRNIVLKSAGDAERAFCYITDAVAGMFTVLLEGSVGEAYNIANESETMPIREVANLLISLYPEKKLEVEFDIPQKMSIGYSKMGRVQLSTRKLEKLGWKCEVNLENGLRYTVDSFDAHKIQNNWIGEK